MPQVFFRQHPPSVRHLSNCSSVVHHNNQDKNQMYENWLVKARNSWSSNAKRLYVRGVSRDKVTKEEFKNTIWVCKDCVR